MINETRKILHDDSLRITATTVRAGFLQPQRKRQRRTKKPFELDAIRKLYSNAPGIVLQDDPANNVYPLARTAENTG